MEGKSESVIHDRQGEWRVIMETSEQFSVFIEKQLEIKLVKI